MWALGAAFSRLWRTEWQRRQRAMELRARVQLHALAMDLLKKPALSPRVLQDPALRRQLLVKLRQQSAMEARSAEVKLRQQSAMEARSAEVTSKSVSIIGVGDGRQRGARPPPEKSREKILFGQLLCKIRAFSGKNHVKFGNFVNFSENIIKIRSFC